MTSRFVDCCSLSLSLSPPPPSVKSNSALFYLFPFGFFNFFFSGDGKCVICDSFVNPQTLVHICDECNYGSYEGRCVVCGNSGVTDAYYCKECVQQEKDRDGCPKVVNLGAVSKNKTLVSFNVLWWYSIDSISIRPVMGFFSVLVGSFF